MFGEQTHIDARRGREIGMLAAAWPGHGHVVVSGVAGAQDNGQGLFTQVASLVLCRALRQAMDERQEGALREPG